MNKLLVKYKIYSKTILINPLLNLNQVINTEIIPLEIVNYIQEIKSFADCLIILADNDEVLKYDQIIPQILNSNQIIISKNDNHQLLKFKDYFDEINKYVNTVK